MINKINGWFFFILFNVFFLLYSTSHAFQEGFPKLVWEKEYPFEIDEVKMAEVSGDVILNNKESAQLILIDSQGYERLHLGPKLNSITNNIDISADGSRVMYQDNENIRLVQRAEVRMLRLHFITRKGEEIWGKNVEGFQYLSPNADWYVLNKWSDIGENIKAYDISGKLLWEKGTEYGSLFSLDNKYFIGGYNFENLRRKEDITIHTYNHQGEIVWEEKFKSIKFDYSGIAEIIKGGYIVLNYNDYHKIYDYLGNIVTEIPAGVNKAFISPDGKAVLFQYDTTFKVLNLPDKSLKMEGNLSFMEAKLSTNGKYLVGLRRPTENMPENIFVFDTGDQSMWKTKIGGDISDTLLERSRAWQEQDYTFTHITNNGKYLLIIKEGRKHLYYYQLY